MCSYGASPLWQHDISKYLYSIRLAPDSSAGSLGTFQTFKAPFHCFWTLRFTGFFWRQRRWKGKQGSNVNISRTLEKMLYVFVKNLSLCCQETHNIDRAALFNCNSLLIALFRRYVDFKSSKYLDGSNENHVKNFLLFFTEKEFTYVLLCSFIF